MSDNLQPYGTQDTAPPSEPLTREEQYLSAIAGVTAATDIPEKPLTRVEEYLAKIVENGGGGGGGTSDYDQLSNRPQINNNTLTGNKTSSDLGLQDALTETQLAAVNSGITSEKLGTVETNILTLQQKTVGMDAGGSTYISVNGHKIFVQDTAPTGASVGDLWIGG